jgi:O-antigen ligase
VSQTAILFLLFFVVMVSLAMARNPIYGVMAYVALVFIDPPSRWWGHALPDMRWSLLACVATVIGMAVHKPRKPEVPFARHPIVVIMLVFIVWLLIQLNWVLEPETHLDLLNYYWKYAVAMYLIYRCVDSEQHLRMFLWTFISGCAYLAWVAFNNYSGGRFDEFGGAGIGEANAGALTLVAGTLIGASLFLREKTRGKVALLVIVPFLVNALIMTISRSGFLALAAGGLVFNLFAPPRIRFRVAVLSVIAALGFFMLTDPGYWNRIESVKYRGAEVEGLDTGSGRLNIMRAQVQMFRDHPLGCGHHCTMTLSPHYLAEEDLDRGSGQRASHNTFMSMLVEHGFVGAAYYLMVWAWIYLTVRRLRKQKARLTPLMLTLTTGVTAALAAQLVADQFVPYVRYEVRFWMFTVLMVMVNLAARPVENTVPAPAPDEETFAARRQGSPGAMSGA